MTAHDHRDPRCGNCTHTEWAHNLSGRCCSACHCNRFDPRILVDPTDPDTIQRAAEELHRHGMFGMGCRCGWRTEEYQAERRRVEADLHVAAAVLASLSPSPQNQENSE